MQNLPEIYGFGEESIKNAISGFGTKIKSFINSKTSGLSVYKKTDKITFKVMSEINKKLRNLPSQYQDDFKIKHNSLSRLGCDTINNMGKNGFPLRVAEAVKRGYSYKDKRFYYDQLYSRVEERQGNTLMPDRLELNGTPIWKLPNDKYTYPEYMDYMTVLTTSGAFSKKSGSDAQLRAFANVDSARNLLKQELSRDIYDDKTRKIMEKYYNDINDWISGYAKQCATVTMFARSLSKQVDVEIRRLTGGDVKVALESFEYDLDNILNGNFEGLEEEYVDYFDSFTSEENLNLEGGLEDIMFYDEELVNTNPDINEFTNVTDDSLFNLTTPESLFGIESFDNTRGLSEMNDIQNFINDEGGLESFIPMDLDYESYVECIGTEGITNFLARGWAKFRRFIHPVIKSDLKVTKVKYDQIKSTFEQTITRMAGPLKNEISQNMFLKFLMDNGALEINERAKNIFDNNSRMVAAVIITFRSSKIKYDDDSGMITVNGKKIDIMELRNDDKIFKGSDASQVIYAAIKDAIRAINKTVYKQIKAEHILDQMGFNVKFLNDGKQRTVKRTGMEYTIGDTSSNTYKYDVEEKNEITTQLNNKDILIGLVSRPLVVTGGTEALFDLDFDDMFDGGSEMDNTITQTIIERMKAVNDTKEMVMKTPEYQRFAAGTEARDSINKAASNNVEVKELLGKVYDKYGMEGLKNILK